MFKKPLTRNAVAKSFACMADALLTSGQIPQEDLDVILSIRSFEEPSINRAAARIAYQALNDHGKIAAMDWSLVDRLVQQAPRESTPLTETLACLKHLRAWHDILNRRGLSAAKPQDFIGSAGLLNDLQNSLDEIAHQLPYATYHELQKAKYTSISDRKAAAEMFAQALRAQSVKLAAFAADVGASTYFSEDDIGDRTPPSIDTQIRRALDQRDQDFANPSYNVLFSADTSFLKMHGAHWIGMAPYLLRDDLGLIILVTGEGAEATIREVRDLIARMARFRGADGDLYARNVIFLPIATVPEVSDIKTFHACARYLFARQIIEVTDTPLLILDIDMTIKEPLRAFLDRIGPYDFSCPQTSGLPVLYPWRRYLAGTGVFKATEGARNIARNIERYIMRGLPLPVSWTLDQNAITFAIEQGGNFGDLNMLKRPVGQDPIRVQFERFKI
jgi:hypothetical protein